jgi:hypothetical protein
LEEITKVLTIKNFLIKAKEDKLIDLNNLIEETLKSEEYQKIQKITKNTLAL